MLRVLGAVAVLAIAAALIEPNWNGDDKALTLRLRQPEELRTVVRGWLRGVGERALKASEKKPARHAQKNIPAAVSAAPLDGLTSEDRRHLDALIEEKLRDP